MRSQFQYRAAIGEMVSWSLLLLMTFAVCTGISTAGETWIIRENGAGPIKIGMNLAQLNATLRERFAKPTTEDEWACFYLQPRAHRHISFMMLDGHLARIDLEERGVATAMGVQVGDTEAQALKTYGSKLKVEPHKYLDDGHYLTAQSSDGHFGVRFETNQGKIERFYAGKFDAIQYVEGCQ